MSEYVTIKINDKEYKAKKGSYIIDVAKENMIDIPTLCHNENVTRTGSCRVCLVELRDGNWSKLVTSCVYPVKENLNVYTDSEKVRRVRKGVFELLLARAPHSKELQEMASKYAGIDTSRYKIYDSEELCILCGLCVRTCDEVVGVSAIGMSNRGIYKKVSTPFDEISDVCIGCGACAFVCPTGAIPLIDKDDTRTIWGKTFKLHRCTKCNTPYIPEEQIDYIVSNFKVERSFFDLCPNCR